MSALPGDLTFNPLNNHYDVASYKRICAEFGIDPSSDFRFTVGKNHGLGRVNGEMQLDFKYTGWMKFRHEGSDANKGNMVSYIRPDPVAATHYNWFAPKTSAGLTQAGLSRINQSIEAFVYCILSAQVNVRSSILGEGGGGGGGGERGTDGVLDTDGRRHKTDRPVPERAKIPAHS